MSYRNNYLDAETYWREELYSKLGVYFYLFKEKKIQYFKKFSRILGTYSAAIAKASIVNRGIGKLYGTCCKHSLKAQNRRIAKAAESRKLYAESLSF